MCEFHSSIFFQLKSNYTTVRSIKPKYRKKGKFVLSKWLANLTHLILILILSARMGGVHNGFQLVYYLALHECEIK